MNKDKLQIVLDDHLKWLKNRREGIRANLRGADLRLADLSQADLRRADLREADLSQADLRRADLRLADLSQADLRGANLQRADLREANLSQADLRGADLREADLRGADLREADLREANLVEADLELANLQRADLREADLTRADLTRADLIRAKNFDENLFISYTSICPEGTLIGWKKCENNIIVKLEIPSKAKRSNATGRKCRAEYVKVLELFGGDVGISKHDGKTEYRVGEIVRCDKWDDVRWNECSGGIHFFLTRLEAERY